LAVQTGILPVPTGNFLGDLGQSHERTTREIVDGSVKAMGENVRRALAPSVIRIKHRIKNCRAGETHASTLNTFRTPEPRGFHPPYEIAKTSQHRVTEEKQEKCISELVFLGFSCCLSDLRKVYFFDQVHVIVPFLTTGHTSFTLLCYNHFRIWLITARLVIIKFSKRQPLHKVCDVRRHLLRWMELTTIGIALWAFYFGNNSS